MKARPILFSGPMVRAILDGHKTQTRRVVKPQPSNFVGGVRPKNTPKHPAPYFDSYCSERKSEVNPRGMSENWCWWTEDDRQGADWIKCPYGKPGDLLWARETFMVASNAERAHLRNPYLYRADGDSIARWTPSIHMPRKASRLTLEITGIRVERLQDCSEADAIAEGCFFTDYGRDCWHDGGPPKDVGDCAAPMSTHNQRPGWMWDKTDSHTQCLGSSRFAYANLWQSINGTDSWDANPWVWVIEFKVHQQNIDSYLKARAA